MKILFWYVYGSLLITLLLGKFIWFGSSESENKTKTKKVLKMEKEKFVRKNDGSFAQNKVQEMLKELESKQRATYLRLYDSKSAGVGGGGNFIPAQPGDFIAVIKGTPVLIEVKSSVVFSSLLDAPIKSVFRQEQILGARLWLRSFAKAICIFYSGVSKSYEVWDMQPIAKTCTNIGRAKKLRGEPLIIGSIEDVANFLANI